MTKPAGQLDLHHQPVDHPIEGHLSTQSRDGYFANEIGRRRPDWWADSWRLDGFTVGDGSQLGDGHNRFSISPRESDERDNAGTTSLR